MYPSDALTVQSRVAVTSDVVLIPTTTTQITVLNAHMDKSSQASQMLQCNVNGGAPFTTFIQAIGTTSQDVNGQWILPVGTVCKMRTFDSTLTAGYLTYVPRNINDMTGTSTLFANANNVVSIIFMLIILSVVITGSVAYVVKKLT